MHLKRILQQTLYICNMKKFRLITLFGLILTLSVTAIGQTTETEYNYLTKGYKIQVESGLDMKKGYSLKDVGEWSVDYSSFKRKATFKALYRDNDSIPCATLMILKRTDTVFEEYVCIPHYKSDSSIWEKARADFKKACSSWSVAAVDYAWNCIKMISFLSSK